MSELVQVVIGRASYSATIQSDPSAGVWVGWVDGVEGANAQAGTRDELMCDLQAVALEALEMGDVGSGQHS